MGVALTGGAGSLQTGVREARKEASVVTLVKNGDVSVKASHCTQSKDRSHDSDLLPL